MLNGTNETSTRPPVRSYLVRAIIVLLALVPLHACAPLAGPPGEPFERSTVDDLLGRLEQAAAEFSSLRGLARVSYAASDGRQTANHVILARVPDKLRIETLGLFGSPALLAATDGERTAVLLPGEGRAFVGPAGSGFLQRIARLPLTTEHIVAILLRRPDILPWQNAAVADLEAGASRLILTADAGRQEIDFNGNRELVRVSYYLGRDLVSVIKYKEYRDRFPALIELRVPARDLVAKIDFSDIETNVELQDGLFRLVPSDAYRVEPIPNG